MFLEWYVFIICRNRHRVYDSTYDTVFNTAASYSPKESVGLTSIMTDSQAANITTTPVCESVMV